MHQAPLDQAEPKFLLDSSYQTNPGVHEKCINYRSVWVLFHKPM